MVRCLRDVARKADPETERRLKEYLSLAYAVANHIERLGIQ
jgi:hypothetical protein